MNSTTGAHSIGDHVIHEVTQQQVVLPGGDCGAHVAGLIGGTVEQARVPALDRRELQRNIRGFELCDVVQDLARRQPRCVAAISGWERLVGEEYIAGSERAILEL